MRARVGDFVTCENEQKKVVKSPSSNIVELLNNLEHFFLRYSRLPCLISIVNERFCLYFPTTNKIIDFAIFHTFSYSPNIDDPFVDSSEQLPYPKSRRMQRVNKTISHFLLHEISFEFFFAKKNSDTLFTAFQCDC